MYPHVKPFVMQYMTVSHDGQSDKALSSEAIKAMEDLPYLTCK